VIPAGFIQELLTRVDIVEVVGRHVQLRKGGANYLGLCPFHGEKSPSFTVSPTKQFFHCFGCGAHGDAIRFLADHTGASFVDTVRDLAQQVGLQVPQDDASPEERAREQQRREREGSLGQVLERAAAHYRQQLRTSPRAVDYLKRRGLTGEIAAHFGLGYAPDGWRGLASVFPRYDDPLLAEAGLVIVQGDEPATQKRYDRFRDRIMFPIRSVKGDVIAFGARVIDSGEPKYLNSPETPLFVKGRELYGLFEARTALRERGYALVTEGYMDVVALAQLGAPNAVATLGTACTADHVHKLLRFTDRVVFSFDGDAAGRRAAARALDAALPHATDTRSFRFLFLPAEHDPDSFIRERGLAGFDAAVEGAVPLSRHLVQVAQEGCDLATAEGRALMLTQARPLWTALPDGSLRRQLLAELARLGGLEPADLADMWRPEARGAGPARTAAPDTADGAAAQPRALQARPHRGTLRHAPRRPEDLVVHLLLRHSAWWDTLEPQQQQALHELPEPHGAVLAWLERDLAEHGPRPWSVLRAALADEGAPADACAALAPLLDDEDGAPATPDDLGRVADVLLLRRLEARRSALAMRLGDDPSLRADWAALDSQWKEVKRRQVREPT
jgi:DNA primase